LRNLIPHIDIDLLTLLLKIVTIVAIGSFLAYLLRRVLFRAFIRILPHNVAFSIAKTTFYVVIFLTILIVIGTLGIDLTALIIAGGFAGIILGLALQPVLSNLFTGLYIMGEKSLAPGELIEVNGIKGRVLEVSIMSTKLQTLDGAILRIPNNKIFDSMLHNYSRAPVRRIDFTVSIAYREDAEKAYNIIKNVLEQHPFVLLYPPPEIFVSNLGSSGVDILVRVWVPSELWYEVSMELLWKIKKAISDAGIEIPFTQIDIWIRSPLRIVHEK